MAGMAVEQLEQRIAARSALVHAALAEIADAAADYDEIGGWCDGGIKSFAHWLTIRAGFDLHAGAELLRVGRALKALPHIAAAFRAGRLSFDKVRQVTTVASPATDDMYLEIALGASGAQLERICREMRRIDRLQSSGHDHAQMAERGLWARYDEDGMLRLMARLPSQDAAIVMAAIESVTGSKPLPEQDGEVQDPAVDRWAARRADALVQICENAGTAPREVVIHVDASDGHAFVDGGTWLTAEGARRIGCDAAVVAVIERDGLPIDVGRKHRLVPERLRRALEVRDRSCRFPGCGVPAHRCHAHHVDHWSQGGPTNRNNLVLLCSFHHHRLHDGAFVIRKTAGELVFETHDGLVIGSRLPDASPVRQSFDPEAPWAEWGGGRVDYDHVLFGLATTAAILESRAP